MEDKVFEKSGLVAVKAIELSAGGFRYVGMLPDGGEVVLRKKATRRYARAYFYPIHRAGVGEGLAGQFTYGKAPANHLRGQEKEVFEVQ